MEVSKSNFEKNFLSDFGLVIIILIKMFVFFNFGKIWLFFKIQLVFQEFLSLDIGVVQTFTVLISVLSFWRCEHLILWTFYDKYFYVRSKSLKLNVVVWDVHPGGRDDHESRHVRQTHRQNGRPTWRRKIH